MEKTIVDKDYKMPISYWQKKSKCDNIIYFCNWDSDVCGLIKDNEMASMTLKEWKEIKWSNDAGEDIIKEIETITCAFENIRKRDGVDRSNWKWECPKYRYSTNCTIHCGSHTKEFENDIKLCLYFLKHCGNDYKSCLLYERRKK